MRAHAAAMVDGGARRIYEARAAGIARDIGRLLWIRACERGGPAARSKLSAQLDGADDPHAQGSARDRLGRLRDTARLARGRARTALRLAQQFGRLPAQLQRGGLYGEV